MPDIKKALKNDKSPIYLLSSVLKNQKHNTGTKIETLKGEKCFG